MSKYGITYLKKMEVPFTCHRYAIDTREYSYVYSVVIIGKRHYFLMNHTTGDEHFIEKDTYDRTQYPDAMNLVFDQHRATIKEERDA